MTGDDELDDYDGIQLDPPSRPRRVPPSQVDQDFEHAISTLPPTASHQKELDWIATHPAMTRVSRGADPDTHVLTAWDILHATNGKAPSQRAARILQNYCARPDKFFDQLVGSHKRKADETSGVTADVDEDIEDVMRILKQVRGRRG